MGRIVESDRLPMVDAILGHWAGADAAAGSPIEVRPGVGRAQVQAKREEYHGLIEQITQIEEVELPLLRSERDTLWGASSEDKNGIWFWLLVYKGTVWTQLGRRHPLAKIVPALRGITPGEMVSTLDRFIKHWERVNAALPANAPLLLGTRTVADVKALHDAVSDKQSAIRELEEGDLALLRAQREALFGDVPEEQREDDSIIADLQSYSDLIRSRYAGQPLSESLPRIFPAERDSLPRFRFNWAPAANGAVQVWLEVPDTTEATQIYLKEGTDERTQPLTNGANGLAVTTWDALTVAGDLDDVELRDAEGRTVAEGRRDEELALA